MLWSDFLTLVNNQLGVEAVRRGTELVRTSAIANACIDLQKFIPTFRQGNTTVYTPDNLTAQGKAMLGQMPAVGAIPKAFYIYSVQEGDSPLCKRYRLDWYPWAHREDMVCDRLKWELWWGNCGLGCSGGCGGFAIQTNCSPCPRLGPNNAYPWDWCRTRAYVYTMSPHGDQFLIYPSVNTKSNLLLVWDGYKTSFSGSDSVNYPVDMAEAVAEYVLWRIRLLVDKDIALGKEHRAAYELKRRELIRDFIRTQYADGKDDEYAGNLVPPPGESLFGAGAVSVPFLQQITALAGATSNCLAAIATTNITPLPRPVDLNIAGIDMRWTLKSGTDANDPTNGVLRPNDFALTSNEKVWYQTTS